MEATHEGDTAADEAGDPGCAAVCDLDAFGHSTTSMCSRVAPTTRHQCQILPRQLCSRSTSDSVSAISALAASAVAVICLSFIGYRTLVASAPGAPRAWCADGAMQARAAPSAGIIIDTLVVVYAFLPVLWILSLSLKPTSNVRDGKLIPSSITLENYGIFTGRVFSSALINSIGSG